MSFENPYEERTSQPVDFNNCLQPARPIAPHELPHYLRVSGVVVLRAFDALGLSEKEILERKN